MADSALVNVQTLADGSTATVLWSITTLGAGDLEDMIIAADAAGTDVTGKCKVTSVQFDGIERVKDSDVASSEIYLNAAVFGYNVLRFKFGGRITKAFQVKVENSSGSSITLSIMVRVSPAGTKH